MDASFTNTRDSLAAAKRADTDWKSLTTEQQVRSLELEGYVVIPDLLSTPQLDAIRAELTNGNTVEGRSWDQESNLYGPPVRFLGVDEYGQLTGDAYKALSSRRAETIARGEGRALWVGNTGDVGGPAEKLLRLAEEEGAPCFTWTWKDRAEAHACPCGLPIDLEFAGKHRRGCPRGEYVGFIARERSRLSPAEFRSLYLAQWADANASPVYTFDREVHVSSRAVLDSALPLVVGADFNVNPMCWIIGQSHAGEAWAADEIVIRGSATTRAACEEFLRRFPSWEAGVIFYGDASGRARHPSAERTDVQTIEEIIGAKYRGLSLRFAASNPHVVDRVHAMNAMLRAADGTVRFWVHPRCRVLADDLARVSWRQGIREIDKRDPERTHASDAVSYWIYAITPGRVGRVATNNPGGIFRDPIIAAMGGPRLHEPYPARF
jgi:hypothetical protein